MKIQIPFGIHTPHIRQMTYMGGVNTAPPAFKALNHI